MSEIGYEDIEIDKLEPNGVLVSPFDDDVCCNIPGCRYKSSNISIFSGRFMKLFSIPSNRVDYDKWCVAIRDGLGLPKAFDLCLPENGHICEMHFAEGKCHVRGVMQEPTIFGKFAVEGLNTSLSSLGALCFATCAVNSCFNRETKTICVPFPEANDPLKRRWVSSLLEADESFRYRSGLAVCTRHFLVIFSVLLIE
ncbi:hypothetical protein DICVIV_07640 [Dictyocaulus viviparus]|uniref:THAP-type domain-containing protein n=1 Tax=Dictyocaulus viviparus TaxID=29172 RepID=A0A0D8XRA4_DICVI|nr:hypothetical protein DICVIV_07640 [Dictyocaulus viviparus]